jgi:hypothetical protein
MKKITLFLVFATIGVGFWSCSKTDAPAPGNEVSQEVKDAIFRLGFTSEGAFAADGGYIVEGDIFLTDEDLHRPVDYQRLVVGGEEQYHTFNTVNEANYPVIKISINTGTSGNSLPPTYVAGLDEAIARYNAENLAFTMQRVSSGADISIVKGNGGYLASAGFPGSNGAPYGQVKVNSNAIGSGTSSTFVNYLATILAHEIGHCIGYRHTDWFNRSISCGGAPSNEGQSTTGVGAVHIPSTPTTSNLGNSWMLSCIGSGQNRPFTNADKIALDYLY